MGNKNNNQAMKGFIGDQLEMIILFFILGIIFILFTYVYTIMGATGNATLDANMVYAKNGMLGMNSLAPIFIVGAGVALILSAFMIKTHPAFFIIFFILQIIFAFISISFANAWDGIWTGSALASTASQFGMWTFLMRYLPFVSMGLGIITAIAIFAKGD